MATSPEEIGRQHGEAERFVGEGSYICAPSIDYGEIPLSWKRKPTVVNPTGFFEEEKKEDNWNGCVSSRGHIDITPLALLCHEGYNRPATTETETDKEVQSKTNLWDQANATVHNVDVTRPSHDKWGIKKIVLMFCDDFLQDVFVMPWWHSRQDMQAAVRPILETLKVPQSRIVRLLLADLPPGVTIPIHHDTGEWVQHTHRVHVPVIVNQKERVLFRCGPIADALERIDCHPGHVFEMNNQAKHAVSNCSADYRVHLILDYVDQNFPVPRRMQLAPGEQLLQTRRSIDRALDKGKRPTPSYMIIGAQKAGTTSLYEYIHQHPLAIKAKRRETHCFDWRWNPSHKTVQKQREYCHKFYFTKELESHPSCLTGDSTPSYLLDSVRVIPRIKHVFDHSIKFFVMLRDPVKRAQSHYAMVTSLDGTPQQIKTRGTEWRNKTLEEAIQLDMDNLKKYGLIPYWNNESGVVDQVIFDEFCGSTKENEAWTKYVKNCVLLSTGSYGLISRGLYELQLRPWLRAFKEDQFMILRLEQFKEKGVNTIMGNVWKHLGLPQYKVEDETPQNARSYESMRIKTKNYLQAFYEPHNQRLVDLLTRCKGTPKQWNNNNSWKY